MPPQTKLHHFMCYAAHINCNNYESQSTFFLFLQPYVYNTYLVERFSLVCKHIQCRYGNIFWMANAKFPIHFIRAGELLSSSRVSLNSSYTYRKIFGPVCKKKKKYKKLVNSILSCEKKMCTARVYVLDFSE